MLGDIERRAGELRAPKEFLRCMSVFFLGGAILIPATTKGIDTHYFQVTCILATAVFAWGTYKVGQHIDWLKKEHSRISEKPDREEDPFRTEYLQRQLGKSVLSIIWS